ncbi:DUF5666 domain-containing protein [Candidatus Microgenomates bacterium]|nr:DUF5666 domain-containing protein [Candidatus Microgenomates bacterium]
MSRKFISIIFILIFASLYLLISPRISTAKQESVPKGQLKKAEKPTGVQVKVEKLGTAKLKELLVETGTDAAKLIKLNKKLLKMEFKHATASSLLKKRHAVMGMITAISGNIITVANQVQSDRTYTVVTSPNTMITGKSVAVSNIPNTDVQDLSTPSSTMVPTLQVGIRISAFGTPLPDGSLLADKIHIIPGKAGGVYNKFDFSVSPISTPSSAITTPFELLPTQIVTFGPLPSESPTEFPANPNP